MSSISSGLQLTSKPMAAGSPPASSYSPGAGSAPAGGNALPTISSSMASPVTGNQPIGQQTYGGVNLTNPPLPNAAASPTAEQNAANAANAQRLNQGLGVLAGGFNAAQGSIGDAMGVSGQYQQAGLNAAAQQQQTSAANTQAYDQGAGIGDANMGALSQRVQGWADQNLNEQANSRQAGLLQNQGQLLAQGGQALGNYLGSANIQGPNIAAAAQGELQAAQLQALQQAASQESAASRQSALTQANQYLNANGGGPTGQGNQYTDPNNPQAIAQQQANNAIINQQNQQAQQLSNNSNNPSLNPQAGQSGGMYDPSSVVPSSIYSGSPTSISDSMLPPTNNPINTSPGAGGLATPGAATGQTLAQSSTALPPGTMIDPSTGQLMLTTV